MILDRAKRATSSTLRQAGQFSPAPLRLAHSTPGDGNSASGVAAFPRRPMAFLWHYIRRRPLLHFAALGSVLLAASCACAAQYGLKMIVDAMAQGIDHIAVAWRALAGMPNRKISEERLPSAAKFVRSASVPPRYQPG